MQRSLGLVADVSRLRAGDHVCMTFASEDEHRAVLTSYLLEGLRGGDRVLYFGHEYDEETIRSYLADAGVRADEYVERGQLAVIPARAAYLPDGRFDADGMLRTFKQQTRQAVDDGYRWLRAAGEMSWVLPDVLEPEPLVEYELRADLTTAGSMQIGACMYDRRRTPADALARVVAVHAGRTGIAENALGISLYGSGDGRVVVDGEVDLSNASFFEPLLQAIAGDLGETVLDLSRLAFIDARGLRALARLIDEQERAGRPLTLSGMSPTVERSLGLLAEARPAGEPGR